jgi:hypothetical protein
MNKPLFQFVFLRTLYCLIILLSTQSASASFLDHITHTITQTQLKAIDAVAAARIVQVNTNLAAAQLVVAQMPIESGRMETMSILKKSNEEQILGIHKVAELEKERAQSDAKDKITWGTFIVAAGTLLLGIIKYKTDGTTVKLDNRKKELEIAKLEEELALLKKQGGITNLKAGNPSTSEANPS